jgi:hypothetical protein
MARSYKTYENETKLGQIKWYMNHQKIPNTSDLMGQKQFSGSCHQEKDQRRGHTSLTELSCRHIKVPEEVFSATSSL